MEVRTIEREHLYQLGYNDDSLEVAERTRAIENVGEIYNYLARIY